MRILLYGLNYAPELTGIGKYSGEMGAWLTQRGHEVRVVTTPPYYPAWRIAAEYQPAGYQIEPGPNGSAVYRCPLYVPTVPSGLRRLLHLSSFALSSLPVLMRLASWEPEVVIAVEPTFFCAPVALLASAFSNAAAWLHIQDFEIDAAFELGLLPQHPVLKQIAGYLEGVFTRRFDRVSSISHNMVRRAQLKGVDPAHTLLFPNWADVAGIIPNPAPSTYREDLGLEGKFVLLYSGNLGNKQGLEVLVPLCESFRGDPRIHFVICGDGSWRPHVEEFAATLPNLTMLPLQPLDRLGELLNTADLHLLPQRAGAADLVMPSKLTGMMASGRPILTTAAPGTQIARVVGGDEELGTEACGLVVPPGDVEAFRAAIVRLIEDPNLRFTMGAAARRYAEEFLGKEVILQRFERDLQQLVDRGKSDPA